MKMLVGKVRTVRVSVFENSYVYPWVICCKLQWPSCYKPDPSLHNFYNLGELWYCFTEMKCYFQKLSFCLLYCFLFDGCYRYPNTMISRQLSGYLLYSLFHPYRVTRHHHKSRHLTKVNIFAHFFNCSYFKV